MDKKRFNILIASRLFSLIALAVIAGTSDTALAQEEINKYLVNYTSSYISTAAANPGTSEAAMTVVTVTSLSDRLCTATVIWRNELGGEICRTHSERLNPGGTENHCSRPFLPISGKPICGPTCPMTTPDGQVIEQEGSVIVQVASLCENQIGADARIYYTVVTEPGPPPSEVILGAHSPAIAKINSASLE